MAMRPLPESKAPNNSRCRTDGSGETWFGSAFGDHAYFKIIRGLPSLEEDEVMLRTYDGYYLNVNADGELEATTTGYDAMGVFKIEENIPEVPTATQIALRSRYLDTQTNTSYFSSIQGSTFHWSVENAQTFTMLEYEEGDFMLRNNDGYYLYADDGGGGSMSWSTEPPYLETFKKEVTPASPEYGTERVRIIADNGTNCFSTVDNGLYQDPSVSFEETCQGVITKFDMIYIDAFPFHSLVNIQSVYTGDYLVARGGNDFPQVDANSGSTGDWETFLKSQGPDRMFSLSTYHGTYIKAATTMVGGLDCSATSTTSYRTWFKLIDKGYGEFSIQTKNTALYWRALADGSIDLNGNPSMASGQFRIIELNTVELAADMVVDDGNGGESFVIPVAGGWTNIVFPNSDVIITPGNFGEFESITGTVGLPMFEYGLGALTALGDMASELPVDIYFGTGQEINDNMPEVVFPLDPDETYFYLRYYEGDNPTQWNGMEFSDPDQGQIQIAIDRKSPTVFMYTDMPFLGESLNAAGFGVSGKANIPWKPIRNKIYTRGLSKTFNAHVWLTADFPVPGLNLPEFADLSIDAEAVASFDPAALISLGGLPTDALEFLGANGVLTASISPFDWLTVWEAELGDASLIINNEDPDDPWIAFNGEAGHDDEYIELPFGMKIPNNNQNNVKVDAYFDTKPNDGHPSYLEIETRIRQFNGLPANSVKLDGRFYAGDDGLEFSGEAKIGTRHIAISGYARKENGEFTVHLEGSFSEGINGSIGPKGARLHYDLNFTVTANLTLGDTTEFGLGVSASAKVTGISRKSVDANVSIQDDGKIKVCANIPGGIGTKCDRF